MYIYMEVGSHVYVCRQTCMGLYMPICILSICRETFMIMYLYVHAYMYVCMKTDMHCMYADIHT